MPFESMVFDPVPEPKTVKNRIHWDVYGDVDDLVAPGRPCWPSCRAGRCWPTRRATSSASSRESRGWIEPVQ